MNYEVSTATADYIKTTSVADRLEDGGYLCKRCQRTKAAAQVIGCGQPGNGTACPMEPSLPVLFVANRAITLPIRGGAPGQFRVYDPLRGEITYVPEDDFAEEPEHPWAALIDRIFDGAVAIVALVVAYLMWRGRH